MPSSSKKMMMAMTAPAWGGVGKTCWAGVDWVGRMGICPPNLDNCHRMGERLSRNAIISVEDDDG